MTIRPFRIDPDIRRAQTPPGAIYGDGEWHARIVERVFPRAWQLVPVPRGAPSPGHAWPITLAPGALDEPAVLTRDSGGTLRCLSNVCTHRGAVVVAEPAAMESLRCRYHGRRFALDGRMRTAPGFDGAIEFPTDSDDLPRLAVAEHAGLVFAGVEPRIAFEEWSTPLARIAHALGTHAPGTLEPPLERCYEFDASWLLYVDNYLEGFHVPYVHPALVRSLELGDYSDVLLDHGTVQIATAKDGEAFLSAPSGHPDEGRRVAAYFCWLFPTTMVNVYPWGLSVNLVEPLGPRRTRVRYLTWVLDPGLVGQGAGGDLDRVEHEDEAIVLDAQRGVRARSYVRGRYSPRHETGVHHFHRMLTAVLFDRDARPERIDL